MTCARCQAENPDIPECPTLKRPDRPGVLGQEAVDGSPRMDYT